MKRRCGNCTACCVIQENDKGVPCPEVTRGGCAIYKERPDDCRKYVCMWLVGFFSSSDRPDRTGLVVEGKPTILGMTWIIYATHSTALESARGKRIQAILRATGRPVVVLQADGRLSALAPKPSVKGD